MIEVATALIASVTAILVAIIARDRKKVAETHKQVSQNSHQNEKPTILDLIADLRDEQRRTNAVIIDHLEWHMEDKK